MGTLLETKFEKMGARVKVMSLPARLAQDAVRIDVRRDKGGEYFDILHREDVSVHVLDVRKDDRHLLLMARSTSPDRKDGVKSKFLCGHDERAWFVAAVPEKAAAASVQSAKDALKPAPVWTSIQRYGVKAKHRDRRKNDAFVRQGEWFFIPRPKLTVKENLVLRREPLRRGGGKPHVCEMLYRTGGELVYVSDRHPNGLTVPQYRALPESERQQRWRWRTMVRDARVFVKGAVRHKDHATIHLSCWHEVAMNTETQALAMRHVAFLD